MIREFLITNVLPNVFDLCLLWNSLLLLDTVNSGLEKVELKYL